MNVFEKLKTWAEMIKLEHTIFSAPFMLTSMLLAAGKDWPALSVFFWCALALFGARSSAMTLNRVIDAKIDAANPRTATRAIPAGQLTMNTSLILSILGFVLLAVSAFNLPKICLYLLPVAITWLSFYSYAKRFSWLCHFVLGIALGGAVLGGWIAVTGEFAWIPVFLALGVSFWVCGFDILYATQDMEFDKENNLHSVPAKFGTSKSLTISKFCHFVSIVFFALAGYYIFQGYSNIVFYGYLGSFICAALGVIYQHKLVEKDLKNVNIAFFNANAWISSLFFAFILIAKLICFRGVGL